MSVALAPTSSMRTPGANGLQGSPLLSAERERETRTRQSRARASPLGDLPPLPDPLPAERGEGFSNQFDFSQPARPANIIKPTLPERAILHEVEGEVVLQLVVAPDGRVKDAQVIQKLGYGVDELALAAIKQSTFDPATDRDGKAVESQAIHRYSFRFSDE